MEIIAGASDYVDDVTVEVVADLVRFQGNENIFDDRIEKVCADLGRQPEDLIWRIVQCLGLWTRKPVHPSEYRHLPQTLYYPNDQKRERRRRTTVWIVRWIIGRMLRAVYQSPEQLRWNLRDQIQNLKLPPGCQTKKPPIPLEDPFVKILKRTVRAVRKNGLIGLITPGIVFEHVVSDCFMAEAQGIRAFDRARDMFIDPYLVQDYCVTLSQSIEEHWPFPWPPPRIAGSKGKGGGAGVPRGRHRYFLFDFLGAAFCASEFYRKRKRWGLVSEPLDALLLFARRNAAALLHNVPSRQVRIELGELLKCLESRIRENGISNATLTLAPKFQAPRLPLAKKGIAESIDRPVDALSRDDLYTYQLAFGKEIERGVPASIVIEEYCNKDIPYGTVISWLNALTCK